MEISLFARGRFLLGVELANVGDQMSAYIKTDDYEGVLGAANRALETFNKKAAEYGYEKAEIERIRRDLKNIQQQAEAGDRSALITSLRILKSDVMPASYKSFATAQRDFEAGIIKWGNEKAEVATIGEPVPKEYSWLTGWLAESPPGLTLGEPAEVVTERKIDIVLKQLKEGVESIQESERFRFFLTTMSKFHAYSIGNQILIMIQRRDASHVAGFNTWKDLGRWVKAGEKGIAILAPVLPPRPTCPSCGAKLPKGIKFCPQCGEPVETEEEIALEPRWFKVVHVFDIAQTEGKPLPEFEVPILTGTVNEKLFSDVIALDKAQGVAVSFEPRPDQDPSIKGQYISKSIWVKPDEPRAQQLKTLLHETAHYYSEDIFHIPRRDAETIAESAAYVVGAHYGFDTGVRSFPYVALWAQDKKILEQNLAAIRRVSTQIIDALEKKPTPTPLAEQWEEPSKERAGRCYELAWRHIAFQDEGTLVHGEVWSQKQGKMIDHAWVITETGFVYEPESARYFEKEPLYKTYKMKEHNRYTPTEARVLALQTHNYGPWTEAERSKFLSMVKTETGKTIPEPLVVRIKSTGSLLTWDAWIRELQSYQKRGEATVAVEYPPLRCKYCGAIVPLNVNPEIWAMYHLRAHKDAVKELAKEKLPWIAGLEPVITPKTELPLRHYWVEKNLPYETWAIVEAFRGGVIRSPFASKEEAIKREEEIAEDIWRLELVPSPQEAFPKQYETLKQLYPYEFLEYHDDGDLTIQLLVPKAGKKWPQPFHELVPGDILVVTTDGSSFKEITK